MSEAARLCPHCGAPNKPGATVCEYCEKPMVATSKPAEEPQEVFEEAEVSEVKTYAQSSGQYSQNNAGTQAAAVKSKVVAGLLGIFLGSLGIHKFYLGYKREGLIMLGASLIGSILIGFIASVVSLVGFVEGIIYLLKSNEDFYNTYVAGKKEWF